LRNSEVEKKRMEEERIQAEEPINCTGTVIIPEGQATRGSGILGLQVMGVFTLCGLLAALGWGGVTGSLVIASRAWTSRKSNSSMDASTSTSETRLRSEVRDLKPA
jgi:hypothetical protein